MRAARPPRSTSQTGIALLVVIMLGAILVPFAAEFAYQINLEVLTAQNVTDQLAIDNAIESQYQIVLARLRYDGTGNQTDSYEDDWNSDEVLNRNDEDSGVSVQSVVFDEQGKLNLRMLAEAPADRRAVWKERLLEVIKRFRRDTKFDASNRADEITDAINNWMTGKTNRGAIPVPKTLDDRRMLLLEELKFVDEVFEKERLLVDIREGEDIAPGLHRYLTIHGNGKINLNTADKIVLQAVFARDEEIAERIIERREGAAEDEEPAFGEEDEEGGGNPFSDVNQIMEVEDVTTVVITQNKVIPADDFVVRTNFFAIRILAQRDASRREELFIVERVPGDDPNGPIEGFRHLLCQERTDPLEYASAGE